MITFHKYHGAGNDFIMVDNRNKSFDVENAKKISLLCDRHFGIGADGLILVENSDKVDRAGSPQADCFMNYYNADGTIAEMCGNGIQCTAKFFLEHIKNGLGEISIDTRAGIKKIICNKDESFSVNMGVPVFSHKDFPNKSLNLESIEFNFVSMGNPHAVGFVKSLNNIDISNIGPKIENNPHFPNKINVELVEKVSDNHFKVKVWERGSGATLSCGSGACAVYAILKKPARNASGIPASNASRSDAGWADAGGEITLEFPGGNLFLSENKKGEIILRGPAVCVFKGEIIQ